MTKEIVETDRETPTVKNPEPEIIDKTGEQENVPQKKSNKALIWGIVAIVIILLIVSFIVYNNLKNKKDGNN